MSSLPPPSTRFQMSGALSSGASSHPTSSRPAAAQSSGSSSSPVLDISSGSSSSTVALSNNLPICWTLAQYEHFQTKYPFIFSSNKALGCHVCREAGSPGALRSGCNKYTFSFEWQNGRVNPYGDTKEKQMKSLRKKIHEHHTATNLPSRFVKNKMKTL